jgi:hypothetical protein
MDIKGGVGKKGKSGKPKNKIHWTGVVKEIQKDLNISYNDAIKKWKDLGKPNPYLKNDNGDKIIKNTSRIFCLLSGIISFYFINLEKKNLSNIIEPILTDEGKKEYVNESKKTSADYFSLNSNVAQFGFINQSIKYIERFENNKFIFKLIVPPKFNELIKKFSEKRFTFILYGLNMFLRNSYFDKDKQDFITYIDKDTSYYHQNIICIDNEKKTVEIFEPNGETEGEEQKKIINDYFKPLGFQVVFLEVLIGDILENEKEEKKFIKSIEKKYPGSFKNKGEINLFIANGIQTIEKYLPLKLRGNCIVWSLLYNYFKLKYNNLNVLQMFNEWFKALNYDINNIEIFMNDFIKLLNTSQEKILGKKYYEKMSMDQIYYKLKRTTKL